MNRKEKESVVSSLVRDFTNSEAVFVINVKMAAQGTQIFKKKLRLLNASMFVAKNTLLRRAAQQVSAMKPLLSCFKNQVSLVFAPANVPAVAAAIKESGQGDNIIVHSGLLHGNAIDNAKFQFVATIPALPVLHAQLCGVLLAPVVQLVHVLKTVAERD